MLKKKRKTVDQKQSRTASRFQEVELIKMFFEHETIYVTGKITENN